MVPYSSTITSTLGPFWNLLGSLMLSFDQCFLNDRKMSWFLKVMWHWLRPLEVFEMILDNQVTIDRWLDCPWWHQIVYNLVGTFCSDHHFIKHVNDNSELEFATILFVVVAKHKYCYHDQLLVFPVSNDCSWFLSHLLKVKYFFWHQEFSPIKDLILCQRIVPYFSEKMGHVWD